MSRRRPPALRAFPPVLLDAVNTIDRNPDPYAVAVAALTHAALSRPIPAFADALHAERHADIVLAALYRRGMLT